MSAPALDNPPVMPTMVSRLPKFGSCTKPAPPLSSDQTGPAAAASTCSFTSTAATSTRLTNGFYHHPGPAGVNSSLTAPPTSVKQNGFIRAPISYSMKWKKENEPVEDGGADGEREPRRGKGGNVGLQYYSQRQQGSSSVSQRDAKKPTTSSAGKGRGLSHPVTSSSSPSPQSSPRTLPVSKSGSHSSKLSQTPFGLTNGTKQALGGLSGTKPRSSSLRQPQSFIRSGGSRPGSGPGSRSGSPLQNKPQASRSHSSDSLGSAPSVQLTESDRLRSRSLTQVRRQPSPTLTPSSTSSSVSRSSAVPRSPAPAPPRGNLSKPPEGGGGGVKVQSSAVPGRSLMPPSALKKPLLPSLGSASKPSGISYKLSRPSLNKPSRPLRVTPSSVSGGDPEGNQGPSGRRNSVETPSTTETSPGLRSSLISNHNLILPLLWYLIRSTLRCFISSSYFMSSTFLHLNKSHILCLVSVISSHLFPSDVSNLWFRFISSVFTIRKFPRCSRDGGADGGGGVPWRAVDCRGNAGGHVPVLQLVSGQK